MDQLSGSSENAQNGVKPGPSDRKGLSLWLRLRTGHVPAWSAVRAFGARFPDQRLAWLVSAWWPAPTVLLGGRGPRRASPGRRAGRSTSSTNKAPQNAAESPPKPAAPPRREQRLTIPPSWGRAEPPIARPRPFLFTLTAMADARDFQKSQNPLVGVMPRPVPRRPATCARHAKVYASRSPGRGVVLPRRVAERVMLALMLSAWTGGISAAARLG